jgi:uncharacterized membrane protein
VSHERLRRGILVAAFAGSAVAFAFLPGSMPRAFGVPPGLDVWVSRALSAFFLPAVAVGCCALLRRLAAADPARGNYRRFQGVFDLVLSASVVFVVGLHATLLATLLLGPRPWLGRIPPLLLAAAVVVVGNALPRVRPNAVIGIMTPWSASRAETWASVHRAGGYVLVAFGLVIAAASFALPSGLGWLVGAGAAAVFVLLGVMSWLISRKEGAAWNRTASSRGSASPG